MLTESPRSRIYYITQDRDSGERDLPDMVRAVLRAGVGMIQYRAKRLSTREMVEEATALVRMTRKAHVPFIVNDRADVALAVGADGIHVGLDDLAVAYARRMMGPSAIIGATTPTAEHARIAERDGATYVAVGAVYPSPSKPATFVLGLEGMSQVQSATSLPVCAIGGITSERVAEVVAHGAELVAVMSAIHGEPDPEAAARELVALGGTFQPPRLPAP